MYYIYGISGPSLLIESTDSMIICNNPESCNTDEADTSSSHKFYTSLPDVDVEADEEVHCVYVHVMNCGKPKKMGWVD